MPKIDKLQAWAKKHDSRCDFLFLTDGKGVLPCTCDVPLKQKLVAFVEVYDDACEIANCDYDNSKDQMQANDRLENARKELEEAE